MVNTTSSQGVTPSDVLKFSAPTTRFLCSLDANTYNVDFVEFQIKDYDTRDVIFHIKAPEGAPPVDYNRMAQLPEEDQLPYRMVRYTFPEKFLRMQTVSTTLTFKVNGDEPLTNFRMVEKHYFKGRLIRSYDFNFPFCIPRSTNTWESVYEVPLLTPDQVEEFLSSPGEHRSDSFYFVNNQLILHNKAEYEYARDQVPATPAVSHQQ